MARPKKVQSNSDDDNTEFSFDPGIADRARTRRRLLRHWRASRI